MKAADPKVATATRRTSGAPAQGQPASAGDAARERIEVPVIMVDGSIADMVNMRASDIDWRHVATTLSKVPRFNGRHEGPAISIAQHQVMGADAIMNETGDAVPAGYFLVHDVHEHPFGDLGRPSALTIDHYVEKILVERGVPVANAHGVGKLAIERAKAHIDIAVHEAAGLPHLDGMPAYRRIVRDMDERMCFAEAKALYGVTKPIPLVQCNLPAPRLTGAIRPWGPVKAEIAYLDRLERYLGIVARVS